ncbi:glycosyltransferase, partial [Patescibacteria group bacterium]
IFHINSTSKGGGVAEMLKSQIALEKDLGLDSRWLVIKPRIEFFLITKKIHDFLQGEKGSLTEEEKNLYLTESEKIDIDLAKFFKKNKPDLIIIHDPQPMLSGCNRLAEYETILRLHVDLSKPNVSAFNFLKACAIKYDMLIVSRNDYRPKWFSKEKTAIIMPAIDPLSLKNKSLSLSTAREILLFHGVNPKRPTISQISRFDPWKDPIGVVKAYYEARNEIPDLQLILVGFTQAADDLTAVETLTKVERYAKGDPLIFIFASEKNLRDVNNDIFVNATQIASDVVLQKSKREGFGLTVTEAMWKGKPVIGGDASGIKLQIKHGENGFLVSNHKDAAKYIVKLIKDNKLKAKIGKKAKKTVLQKFLLPRYIKENLEVYKKAMK